jgi:hypothetical protein
MHIFHSWVIKSPTPSTSTRAWFAFQALATCNWQLGFAYIPPGLFQLCRPTHI